MITASVPRPRVGVQVKLLGAFALVALFTVLLGMFAVASIEQLNTAQRTTYRDIFGGTHMLATWVNRAGQTRRATLAYAASQRPEERAALREQIAAGDVELERLSQQIDNADTDREEVAELAQIVGIWRDYVQWRDAALAAADAANDPTLVMVAYGTDGARLDSAIDAAIDAFLTSKRDNGGLYEISAQLTYDQMRRLAIALSITAGLVALGIGLFISRQVAGAAVQVAAAAEGLSRGELDQQIEVNSRDELGDMAVSFRQMVAYQQEMARVANAIAKGDLTQDIEPRSDSDVLGLAFRRMSENLRLLVHELQEALSYTRTLLVEKDGYAATVCQQVIKLSRLLQENATLHDRLRRAAVRTAVLNEQALRRIGADLHDGPCQALAFALLSLDTADGSAMICEPVRTAVSEALGELRSIAAGLRPPELVDLSLRQVVERTVRDHERRSGAQVRVDVAGLLTDAVMPVKVALFRALQEALSNATRHAHGADVTVRAWLADDWLWLTVADRGPGFAAVTAEAKGRLGLASMRDRAELLGGQFQVESAPGCGTLVQLCWPLSVLSHEQAEADDAVAMVLDVSAA